MVTVTSVWPPLITIGIVASSLCSAMSSLVSAPRVFQAVCTDKLIPKLAFFAKGYGPGNDPRRAYALAFLITVFVVMIGNLNVIAPFISNFFLCAYALVNYACFTACLSQTPGFRPAFPLLFAMVVTVWSCDVRYDHVHNVMAYNTVHMRVLLHSLHLHKTHEARYFLPLAFHSCPSLLLLAPDQRFSIERVQYEKGRVLVLSGVPHERPALIQLASSITRGAS
ncbi:hypothetical protein OSTOST_04274, partial [Ostertagia ostertagi]